MVRVILLSVFTPGLKKVYGLPLGQKIKYYWMNTWNTRPEIMGTIPMIAASVVLCGLVVNRISTEKRRAKYCSNITIFRPDDPRVAHITKDETLIGERIL